MVPDSALPAILLSGVVAGVLLLGAGLLSRRGRERLAQILAALAVGAGLVVGSLILEGRPSVPPSDVQGWLVLLAPAAVLVGAFAGATKWPAWASLLLHAVYSAIAGFLLLRPLLASWSTTEAILSSAGYMALSLGAASTLAVASERLAGRWAAIATFFFASGSSFLLIIAGSVRMGLLGGVLAATAGAAVAVSLLGLGLERTRGLATTLGALATLQWARGYFYGDLKPAAQGSFVAGVVLLALVPLAALLGQRLTKGTTKPVKATLIRLALVGAPVALALGLALATSPRFAPSEPEDY